MKKINLINVGTISNDMKFWMINSKLYTKLSVRGSELLEKAGRKFMGKYYDRPKPTRTELQDLLDKQQQRIKSLRELKTPEPLLEGIKSHINELEIKIKNKDYENPLDPKYKNYKKKHKEKLNAWVNTETYTKLINDIYYYNEQQYKELEEQDIKNNNKIVQLEQA